MPDLQHEYQLDAPRLEAMLMPNLSKTGITRCGYRAKWFSAYMRYKALECCYASKSTSIHKTVLRS